MTSIIGKIIASMGTAKQGTVNLVGRFMKSQRQTNDITWQGTLDLVQCRGNLSNYVYLTMASQPVISYLKILQAHSHMYSRTPKRNYLG